jgi:hypothetical protein
LFLEKKKKRIDEKGIELGDINDNRPQELVLKIFNNVFVDDKDYLSIIYNALYDENETSKDEELRISADKTNFKFMKYKKDDFESINFTDRKKFIKANDDTYDMILCCRNNDAINDFIVSLVLNYIKKNPNTSKGSTENDLKFVKYYNFCAINILIPGMTGVTKNIKYCIIMEKTDGDLVNYFKSDVSGYGKDPNKDIKSAFDNTSHDKVNQMTYIFEETEKLLNSIKNERYLFTHTDMKLGNVFYTHNQSDPKKPNLLLADFDKSSITFNGVRFYNDITFAGRIKSTMGNYYSTFGKFLTDKSLTEDRNKRLEDYENNRHHSYDISKFLDARSSVFGSAIKFAETEQIFMRYNFTPYYLSFDMVSFIISVLSSGMFRNTRSHPDGKIQEIITKYICDLDKGDEKKSYKTVYDTYRVKTYVDNFGEIIKPLIVTTSTHNKYVFKNYPLYNQYCNINKVHISKNNQKIILTLPLCVSATEISKDAGTKFIINITDTNTALDKIIADDNSNIIDRENVKNLYDKFYSLESLGYDYNNNYSAEITFFNKSKIDNTILCITNRYSLKEKEKAFMTTIYEYIYPVNNKESAYIIKDFLNTNNNTESTSYIPHNAVATAQPRSSSPASSSGFESGSNSGPDSGSNSGPDSGSNSGQGTSSGGGYKSRKHRKQKSGKRSGKRSIRRSHKLQK